MTHVPTEAYHLHVVPTTAANVPPRVWVQEHLVREFWLWKNVTRSCTPRVCEGRVYPVVLPGVSATAGETLFGLTPGPSQLESLWSYGLLW
jgi:hypothetical protein